MSKCNIMLKPPADPFPLAPATLSTPTHTPLHLIMCSVSRFVANRTNSKQENLEKEREEKAGLGFGMIRFGTL